MTSRRRHSVRTADVMAVYVDGAKNPLKHMLMSHMVADTEAELHAMAQAIGLKREWFQDHNTPHYDLCQEKRTLAVARGAVQVGRRQLVAIIRRLRQERYADQGRPTGQALPRVPAGNQPYHFRGVGDAPHDA